MILTFKNKETAKIFEGFRSSKIPIEVQMVGRRKLRMMHNAETIDDLRVPPANRLKKLKGNLDGYYSIRINDQWRIVFKWSNNHASEVSIEDYHD